MNGPVITVVAKVTGLQLYEFKTQIFCREEFSAVFLDSKILSELWVVCNQSPTYLLEEQFHRFTH